MKSRKKILPVLFGICCIISNASSSLHAQTKPQDEELETYTTGLVFDTPESIEKFTKAPVFRAFLPEKVDISSRMPRVGNQGRQGSCVGWAVAYAARSYYRAASGKRSLKNKNNIASPAYVYNSIRVSNCAGGSYISSALNLLKKGALSIKQFPYTDRGCRKPTLVQKDAATDFKIKAWQYINPKKLDQVKGALAKGHPVIIGAKLNASFHRLRRGRVWKAGKPKPRETGGHAFTIVGYNDRRKQFHFINSWGRRWGTRGYGWMTYDTFKARVTSAYKIIPENDPPNPNVVIPKPTPKPKPKPTPKPKPKVKVQLPKFECSRLRLGKTDTRKTIEGFVAKQKDLGYIKKNYGKVFKIDIDVRPWPQCEALLIVGKTGGNRAAKIELKRDLFTEGEMLPFKVKTPKFSSYLHLAYFQADGSVVNLMQSSSENLITLSPSRTIKVGDGKQGRSRFKVQGPFGNEMILAITTRSPLFIKSRPKVETEREFLSALRAATIDMEKSTGLSRYYAANEVSLVTKPKENK